MTEISVLTAVVDGVVSGSMTWLSGELAFLDLLVL